MPRIKTKAVRRAFGQTAIRRKYVRVPIPPTEAMLRGMNGATFLNDGSLLEMERRFNGMLRALEFKDRPMVVVSYSQAIRWTIAGGTETVTAQGCASMAEAKKLAIEYAKSRGWTPPKWWQFWRWNDTRIELEA